MHEGGDHTSLPLVKNHDLHKKNPGKCSKSSYYDDFEKSEQECFLSKQQIYSMSG